MPCPVCVVDAVIICGCRFFGIPDPVTCLLLGVIAMSLAIVTLRWIKKNFYIDETPKGSLIFILTVYLILALLTMKAVGMI